MSRTRLIALLLLIASIGCACLGLDFALTFVLIPLRMADGTIATPGMGIAGGACLFVPGVALGVASGVLWFVVLPDQRAKARHDDRTNHLQGQALSLYREWITLLQLQHVLRDPERGDIARQNVRAVTLSLLADLDGAYKRALIQFLYDTDLIVGTARIDLAGANLQGIDLRGAELPSIDLHGTDLRGALLDGARLMNANLCDALVTADQLARATTAWPQ
jgi:hypothetical protein